MSVASVDLGTHGVRVALLARGRARPLAIGAEGAEMAAAVAFGDGPPVVGDRALRRAVTRPSSTLRAFLPILGSPAFAPPLIAWVARAGLRLPPTGEPILLIDDARVPLVEAAALLLRPAIDAATQAGGQLTRLMLPVAGWLEPDGREALLAAARAAGAASAHAVDGAAAAVASLGRPDRERVFALVDVGAAAVTASLVTAGPKGFRRLAAEVAMGAGGDAVDLALVEAAVRRYGLPRSNPAVAEMLRQAFGAMKHDLSVSERATFPLPLVALGGSSPDNLSLDAAEFASGVAPTLRAVDDTATAVLGMLAGDAQKLAGVYLTGGMGRVAAVQRQLAQSLGRPVDRVLPVGAAASGAALMPPPQAPLRRRSTQSLRPPRASSAVSRRPSTQPRPGRPSSVAPRRSSSVAERPDAVRDSSSRSPAAPGRVARARAKAPGSRPGATKPTVDSMPKVGSTPPAADGGPRRATSRPEPRPDNPATPAPSMPPAPNVSLEGGRIENPIRAADVLALPLRRPMGELDTQRIALPVLLHVLSRQKTTGTLVVTMDGASPLHLPCENGRFSVAASERKAVVAAFRSASGSWQLQATPPPMRRRSTVRTRALVVEGLRKLVWSFDDAELTAALGARMHRAPKAASSEDRRVQRLGLSPAELRLMKFGFDGRETSETIISRAGAGRLTALFVLVLLTVYALVEWGDAEERAAVQPEEQVRKRAAEVASENHFEVLGLHWSANDDEVQAAYRDALAKVRPGGAWDGADSEASARLRARVEVAWETLRNSGRRAAHRSEAYPTVSYDMLEQLLAAKAKAMTLRDEEGSKKEYERIEELRRTKRRLRSRRAPSRDDDDETGTG